MDLNSLIIEHANDGIISLNSKGCVVGWNRKAQTLFGYRLDEIEARPISIILPELFRLEASVAEIAAPLEMTGIKNGNVEVPVEVSI